MTPERRGDAPYFGVEPSATIKPVLVLVGPPGSGKSTVGELVASRLGVAFRDTDRDIEAAAGESIADIFVGQGEPRFRELERGAVRAALAEHPGVLALGGGSVVAPETRALLTGHRVVFLDVSVAEAAARVGFNRDRPLLLGNARGQLRRLMAERRPVYEAVATRTVNTDGRTPEEIAAEVAALVSPDQGAPRPDLLDTGDTLIQRPQSAHERRDAHPGRRRAAVRRGRRRGAAWRAARPARPRRGAGRRDPPAGAARHRRRDPR